MTKILPHFKLNEPKGKTVFEIQTDKLHQLPLVDFLPHDYGKPQQAFGFEFGPVCFS